MGNACCGEREREDGMSKVLPFDKNTYVPPSPTDAESLHILCEAAEDDDKDVRELKHLLEKPNMRECINLQEETGFTPLLYAALSCHVQKIQVLLDAGANLFVLESRGFSALHFAAKSTSSQATEAVRLLLEAGADSIIDVQDKDGKTALHYAAASNNRAMVQELLNHGASVNIPSNDDKIPLSMTKDDDIQRLLAPGRRSFSSTSSTLPTSSSFSSSSSQNGASKAPLLTPAAA